MLKVESLSSTVSSSSEFVTEFVTEFENAMQTTPTKLKSIASTSKLEMDSDRKSQPRIVAQKGAVLNIVFSTTKGTKAVPKVIDVNPIVPARLLMARIALSDGCMKKFAFKHSPSAKDPKSITSVR